MKLHHNQAGFSAFEFVVIVLVLTAVGVASLRILNTHSATPSPLSSTATAKTTGAPAVKSSGDLDKAQKTLDQNDPTTTNSSDSTQLDSQLSGLN